MVEILTDQEIRDLLQEPKPLPKNFRKRIEVRPKHGHKERELFVKGRQGSEFRLILRQSDFNRLDFSVILVLRPRKSSQHFRLCRYNGKSHEHTNPLEGETFYDYHIHLATERYQESGYREDTYAEITDRYTELAGAIECLIDDCGFERPEHDRLPLFE